MQVLGALMVLPFFVAVIYKENYCASMFFLLAGVFLFIGVLGGRVRPKDKTFFAREGMVMTALIWISISVMCAFVFQLSGVTKSYIDALFETVSGFSTTGASILETVEGMPRSVQFFRCFSHWIGGMGVLVFMLAILPKNDGYTMQLMRAESPGPSVGKFVPKVRGTARILYYIYLSFTVLETILLMITGLPLYDALTVTFSCVGTGGFAITDMSAAAYPVSAQVIIIIFMTVCGTNFGVYYYIFVGRFKDAFRNEEVRWFLILLTVASVAITLDLTWQQHTENLGESILHAVFTVTSVMSTTGFATMDYNIWPPFAKSILFVLMIIGACAGSTAGGFKISRVIIVMRRVKNELIFMTHPRSIRQVMMDGRRVPSTTVKGVMVYGIVYFLFFAVSLLCVSIDGFDFETNVSAVTTTMSNVGPGFWLVGPTGNYHMYSPFSKLVLCADMLAGRLEFYPLLILFRPGTYRNA